MVRLVARCLPLPSAVGTTVAAGAWTQMKSGIIKKRKKIQNKTAENAFNDEQVLGVENVFKSACSCYYFRVIHRLVFELQITASVSDLHWSRAIHI